METVYDYLRQQVEAQPDAVRQISINGINELDKSRLETLFGLEVVAMPHALKGIQYLY